MQLSTDISGPLTVIGDVHGYADALRSLLAQLKQRPDFLDRWIVFVGDFMDRGPDSRGVLDLVTTLHAEGTRVTAVCGNHDFAAAAALGLFATPPVCNWDQRYLGHYNAEKTFTSYGVGRGDLPALQEAMPPAHKQWLAGLPWAVFHPQYLIVHAGLLSDRSYVQQLDQLRKPDRTLNAPPWLCDRTLADSVPADCPLIVVSGHVPVPQVVFRPQRVLVDTTGGMSGTISAVLLPEAIVLTAEEESAAKRTPARSRQ